MTSENNEKNLSSDGSDKNKSDRKSKKSSESKKSTDNTDSVNDENLKNSQNSKDKDEQEQKKSDSENVEKENGSKEDKESKSEKSKKDSEKPDSKKDQDSHQDYDDYPYEDDFDDTASDDPEQSVEDESESSSQKDEDVEEDDDDEEFGQKEKRMPFLDHLEELRWTILRSLVAVVIAAIISYIFSKQIVTFLRMPGPEDLKLIFLSPTEGFMIYIKVAIFSGLVIALPYVAYEFWKFIVPGLLDKEKKLVGPIALFTTICFLVGATFAYTVIIPFGLRFLLGFQTEFLSATITIGKYLGFVVTIILVFGVVFELPVLSFFLTKIGILTPKFLKEKRAYGIVIIFIMAAVLTPPDIFTQLMLAGPLILLYELSIWVSKLVVEKKEEADQEENS